MAAAGKSHDLMIKVSTLSRVRAPKQPRARRRRLAQHALLASALTPAQLMMIGDQGVGKSALLIRYADDDFSENVLPTIGIDFKIKVRARAARLCAAAAAAPPPPTSPTPRARPARPRS